MKIMRRALLCSAVLLAAAAPLAEASVQDADDTLGFENAADWTIQNGTILGTSTTHTQGLTSLAVQPNGFTTVKSRLLGPLGQVLQTISFDLGLPAITPGSWAGAVQMYVSVPSLNINNAYLGQVALNGLNFGQFNRLTFAIPASLLPTLQGNYSDLTFSIVFNLPTPTTATYLLDNLEVSSTIPPNSTVGAVDRLPILGFEDPSGWSFTQGTGVVDGLSGVATQGNFSLGVSASGYTVLTSRPMPSIGPVNGTLTFDLEQPTQPAGATWFGAVQLYVNIPSEGINSAYVGQVDLTSLPVNQFSTLSFPLPGALVTALNGTYTDLTFSIALNLPTTETGEYFLDNFNVGALTTPPVLLPQSTPIVRDLAGLASTGMFQMKIDGSVFNPPLTLGAFYVEEVDKRCAPTETTACRYIVHLTRFRTGGFSFQGKNITAVDLLNLNPFELTIGGSGPSSLSATIPSNVPFGLLAEGQDIALSFFPGDKSTITISPTGAGLLSMTANFQGSIDGHNVSVNMSVTADSPLANQPPVAVVGPPQTVSSTTCVANAVLDASGSTDPDNDIVQATWYLANQGQNVFWGTGLTQTAPINFSGPNVFTVVVTDSYGSQSSAQTTVTANLPSGCP